MTMLITLISGFAVCLFFLLIFMAGWMLWRTRLIAILQLQYPSMWETLAAAPDYHSHNVSSVSTGRLLRVVFGEAGSMAQDSELLRAARWLKISFAGFRFCLIGIVVLALFSKLAPSLLG